MQIDIDGISIFANTGGRDFDTAQPVFILVHGSGCDHSIWAAQSRYLAHHGVSVLAIDLPGHGRSGGEALGSIGAQAEFLERLIGTLKIATPVLVGHSMGALAVLEAAGRMGSRLAGLGLCGVAARMPVHPDLLAAAERNELAAAELIASWGHGGRSHRGGNPAHGIWMIRNAVRLIDRSRDGVLHTDLAACDRYEGALAAAGNVTCPTRFILGDGDKMTPVKAARPLIDAVAGAEVDVLRECGHMMMIEAPDAVRDALKVLAKQVAEKGVADDAARRSA